MTPQEQRERYETKPDLYYGNPRRDYVAALPVDPSAKVLELGCGDGATGALARHEGRCGTYVGIEMFEPMAARARERLDEVHVGNVEAMDLPFSDGAFDALIMSEVLEHLIDPEATVRRLLRFVRSGGLIFASSPNISHWQNLRNLARGRFDYTESGMMDRTHLHWFTPESFRRMFSEAGAIVDSIRPLNTLTSREGWMKRIMGPKFDSIWFYQIDLRAHNP